MLDHLLALSPIEFERAVARLMPYLGCSNPQLTGKAGDLGADIVCTDEHGGLVVVQCKRYMRGNNVTSPNIQQFFGMLVHHGARTGIYVTTSSFTRSAAALAEARDILTIDGPELVDLFTAHPDLVVGLGVDRAPARVEAPSSRPRATPRSLPRATPSDLAYVILRDLVRPSPLKVALLLAVCVLAALMGQLDYVVIALVGLAIAVFFVKLYDI